VLNQLRQHRFDMQATAKALGWDRSTVTQRLKGLCFQALVESGRDQTKAASALAGDPSLLRAVELKLMDYYGHLMETIEPFTTAEEALLDCKRALQESPRTAFQIRRSPGPATFRVEYLDSPNLIPDQNHIYEQHLV
jgi:hypothetical protein